MSDHVTNMSVRESTGLTTINQYLRRQRLFIFGHIARLDPAFPANAALRLAVDTKEGRRPDPSWSRRPGRPRHTWADQVREDVGIPCQRYGLLRLPKVTERRDGPRPGDNDDDE